MASKSEQRATDAETYELFLRIGSYKRTAEAIGRDVKTVRARVRREESRRSPNANLNTGTENMTQPEHDHSGVAIACQHPECIARRNAIQRMFDEVGDPDDS